MLTTLDVLNSTLASTLRFWRGTNARAGAIEPAKHLQLYEFEACPFCRLVREALTELDLDALIFPTPHGGKRFRPKVEKLGGRQQFPYLVDPNTGESMYESADIIDYLYRRYGGRPAPTRLLRPLDVSSSVLASIPRLRAGSRARPSRAPKRPLELFSFESSPYSRRVRELLSELELPYVLRSTGKARWQDLGPPALTQPSTNTIVWRWDRDPFGTTPPNTDPDANGLQLPFNQRFPGQTAFDESGLNYNYFRDYDPQTGRYVESDPIGLKGGVSTYGYVGANPLSRVDPKGENWWWVIPGIVLAYEAINEGWQVYQLQDCVKKCVANSCNDDGTSRMPGSTEGDTRPNLACRQRCTLNIYGKPNGPGPLWPVSR